MFGQSAKKIKNCPQKNEVITEETELKKSIREIERLKECISQLESEAKNKKQLTEELGSVLCVSSKNRRQTVCVPQLSRCKPIVMSPVKSTVLSSRLNMPPPNVPMPARSPSKFDALSLPSVNYEKQFMREAAFQRLLATIQDLQEQNERLKEQLSNQALQNTEQPSLIRNDPLMVYDGPIVDFSVNLDASQSSMSTNTRRQTLVSWQDKSNLYEHNSSRPSGMETFDEEEEEVSSHSPSHPQADHPLMRDSAALTQMPDVNNTESSFPFTNRRRTKGAAQLYLDALEERNEELREAVDEVEKLQRKIECGKEFLAEKDQRIEESEQHSEAWQTHSLAAVVQPNRPNFYGAVPDVDVGTVWRTRLECSHDGVHRPPVAGIHAGDQGAFSIALSGGYEDDVDLGETFTYSGEDQSLTRGNLALLRNVETRNPVRVIRGYKLNSPFAPEEGYRYDGLYTVEKSWFASGVSGHSVWKFQLKRIDGQAPPPWQITSEGENDPEHP
ncbi:E3 ubiquitin-protein ligase uhrf1 [Bulinus truncatus]|nr:E3 ubiquitin-protein ligase uhrf1 [Bulinus truncatus]